MKIFISHAPEDKEDIAKPLADALKNLGYEVWYDDFSLKLGDSLCQEIDKGLATCDYGIVILSKPFFSKDWPQRELAGLGARETGDSSHRNIILPIWHNIGADFVRQYSPLLADRISVNTSESLPKIIEEINRVTQFIYPEVLSRTPAYVNGAKNAKDILNRIVPAGPVQPDGGQTPNSIRIIEQLVKEWEANGEVSFLVKVDTMSPYDRRILFNQDKFVILFPTHGMHQVRIEVVDLSYKSIGMIWTPLNITDSEYHHGLEFFLQEMGFLEEELRVPITPIINSDNSFWITIQ